MIRYITRVWSYFVFWLYKVVFESSVNMFYKLSNWYQNYLNFNPMFFLITKYFVNIFSLIMWIYIKFESFFIFKNNQIQYEHYQLKKDMNEKEYGDYLNLLKKIIVDSNMYSISIIQNKNLTKKNKRKFKKILKMRPECPSPIDVERWSDKKIVAHHEKVRQFNIKLLFFYKSLINKNIKMLSPADGYETWAVATYSKQNYEHLRWGTFRMWLVSFKLSFFKYSYMIIGYKLIYICLVLVLVNYNLYSGDTNPADIDIISVSNILEHRDSFRLGESSFNFAQLFDNNENQSILIESLDKFYALEKENHFDMEFKGIDTKVAYDLADAIFKSNIRLQEESLPIIDSLCKHYGFDNGIYHCNCAIQRYQSGILNSTGPDFGAYVYLFKNRFPVNIFDNRFLDCLEATNIVSGADLINNYNSVLEAGLAHASPEIMDKLFTNGFYEHINPYSFVSTQELMSIINNGPAASKVHAIHEFTNRLGGLRYVLNQTYTYESITDSGLSFDTMFKSLQNDLEAFSALKNNYLLQIRSVTYVVVIISAFLSLLMLFVYIPMSSIIFKIVIGLLIFLSSAGFVFFLIPDFAVFGVLIIIIYCSAIAILIVIAFFLLRSKVGDSIENVRVASLVYFMSLFLVIGFIGYLVSIVWTFPIMTNEQMKLYVSSGIVQHLMSIKHIYSINDSVLFTKNFYSLYGSDVSYLESSWYTDMSIMIYHDFINFVVKNNETLRSLLVFNIDEVSLFERMSYIIYNNSYYLILLLLGILLLLVFIIITWLLYKKNKDAF